MLPGGLHGEGIELRPHAGGDLGRLVVEGRWFHEGLVEGTGAIRGQVLEPRDRLVVGRIQRRIIGFGGHHHVHDQDRPLAPVVDRHQLADDRHDPVGEALVVGRGVGEVLHLPHHVIAQVAHQPAVEGRHPLDPGRFEVGQQVLEGRQHAVAGTDAVRQVAVNQQFAADRGERGAGVAPDEGPAAPRLTPVHALEQETLTVTDAAGEEGYGGGQVG